LDFRAAGSCVDAALSPATFFKNVVVVGTVIAPCMQKYYRGAG